jgi:hypothetical protein
VNSCSPGPEPEYDLERLVFEPDPEKESTWIHVVRATSYFTKDLFLKVFFQTNTSIDKHNIQVLFVWRFQPPFGLVQLAFQKGTARFGVRGTRGTPFSSSSPTCSEYRRRLLSPAA